MSAGLRHLGRALVDCAADVLNPSTRLLLFRAIDVTPSVCVSRSEKMCRHLLCSRAYSSPASTSGETNDISISQSHLNSSPLVPAEVASRLMVDTLVMMKQYEANGLSRGQAEALTRQITAVILSVCAYNDSKYITNEALERLVIELRAQQKHQAQELQVQQQVHLAGMSKDTERLQAQLDKFKADIKHEVDKLTANQKLDLNLERGRLRDELQQVRDKVVQMNSTSEREVNSVRTYVESSKSDTLKWVVVTVSGLLGVGLAGIRLVMSH